MELFTLDRNLKRLDEIEEFESVIWTERYLGDGDVEMVVPATPKLTQKLFPGTFISLEGTNEIMVLDTLNIEDKKMKINGKSLLQWFNNRFVRTSDLHKEQTWYINDQPAGQILWVMIKEMATEDSTYLKGEIPIGIIDMFLQRLIVPELGLHSFDTSGDDVSVAVPFGPLYDAMREVAATYNIGMQIVRQGPEADHPLGFRSYRGLDRTSQQDENPVVRFSSFLESLANIKELQSNALEKNLIFTFAPDASVNPFTPGISYIVGSEYAGFDLRAAEIFVEGGESSDTNVVSVLDSRAKAALAESSFVRAIDGDLLHTHQFQYGRDFGLGDLVEIVGTGGVAYSGRITEFIRSQDSAGEKGYPLYQSPQGLASASGEKGYPTVKIGGELRTNKPKFHAPVPPPPPADNPLIIDYFDNSGGSTHLSPNEPELGGSAYSLNWVPWSEQANWSGYDSPEPWIAVDDVTGGVDILGNPIDRRWVYVPTKGTNYDGVSLGGAALVKVEFSMKLEGFPPGQWWDVRARENHRDNPPDGSAWNLGGQGTDVHGNYGWRSDFPVCTDEVDISPIGEFRRQPSLQFYRQISSGGMFWGFGFQIQQTFPNGTEDDFEDFPYCQLTVTLLKNNAFAGERTS